jgi:hypothetical protein
VASETKNISLMTQVDMHRGKSCDLAEEDDLVRTVQLI